MKTFTKPNISAIFGIISTLLVIVLLSGSCSTFTKLMNTDVWGVEVKYQGSYSKDQCARVYIGNPVQVIGVDGNMSPLKYIAAFRSVILFQPGERTININAFDGRQDQPTYPGIELKFTAESGKNYYVSVNDPGGSRTLTFQIRELNSISSFGELSPQDRAILADKEKLQQQIDAAIAEL
jgi:hypothetical protein